MPGKRNVVIREILDLLLEGTELLFEWMENPHAQRRRLRGVLTQQEWEQVFGDQRKKKALRRLRKKQWVEDRQQGNIVTFTLSDEALIEHLKQKVLENRSLPKHQKTIVAFDFPEVARKARLMWRRLLKKLGFTKEQQSVWVSKFDVGEHIQSLAVVLKITAWVKVYRAETLS
jgi:DNA-binding transcriptional regulator PaaX